MRLSITCVVVSSPARATLPSPESSAVSSLAHSTCASFMERISPPPNPISTLTSVSAMLRSVSRRLNQLDQHTVDALRVDECNLQPEQPDPRRLVDQLAPGCRGIVERILDAVDAIGDVVHPRAPLGQEPADRRVL